MMRHYREWKFIGALKGLSNFCKIIDDYTKTPSHIGLSEHIHIGPQEYLKIVTWNIPLINNDGVYGSFDQLNELSNIFKNKLSKGKDFIIDQDYSRFNEAHIFVQIKEESFDPASLDNSIDS